MQARILIVDDDQDILSALKKRLTWMGHEVFTAEDGQQALRLIAEDQPELMLLDIELPDMSGIDVLKHLADKRSTGSLQSLPEVIVITAFGTSAGRSKRCGWGRVISSRNRLSRIISPS